MPEGASQGNRAAAVGGAARLARRGRQGRSRTARRRRGARLAAEGGRGGAAREEDGGSSWGARVREEKDKGERRRWSWKELDDGEEGDAEPPDMGKGAPSCRTRGRGRSRHAVACLISNSAQYGGSRLCIEREGAQCCEYRFGIDGEFQFQSLCHPNSSI